MSMVLSNKQLINGVNPRMAKKMCLLCQKNLATAEDLAKSFEVSETTMTRWLLLLAEAGFMEMKGKGNTILWTCSAQGSNDLAKARFGKPLSGAEFSELILKVIERIESYNSEPYHPFTIHEAYLFGSILSQPWLLDDPNIIIDISPKPEISRNSNWRTHYCAEFGPSRNLTFVDQLYFPEHELLAHLHKPREKFTIFSKESTMPEEFRLIYRKDAIESRKSNEAPDIMSLDELASFGHIIDVYRKGEVSNKRKQHVGPSLEGIAEYWRNDARFQKLCIPIEDASGICWRCGSKRDLQRCHIIPDSLGGRDEEANYVILCSHCHAEGPNISDKEIMFDWVSSYRARYGEDYWPNVARAEYQRVYGKSVQEEVVDLLERDHLSAPLDKALVELELLANEASTQAIHHFGQSWYNDATAAGLYRLALRKLPDRLRRMT